jgi:hypothetical protein
MIGSFDQTVALFPLGCILSFFAALGRTCNLRGRYPKAKTVFCARGVSEKRICAEKWKRKMKARERNLDLDQLDLEILRNSKRYRGTREGYAQYLLACLILGRRPPAWNAPASPSVNGKRLLDMIDGRCFVNQVSELPDFYWEFELKAIGPWLKKGWPDLAASWPERKLLLELKTEPGSHRDGQVDQYLSQARLNHPQCSIDLIYLTRDPIIGSPALPDDRIRYANITWSEIADMLELIFKQNSSDDEQRIATHLAAVVRNLAIPESRRALAEIRIVVDVAVAVGIAEQVEMDRKQRALELEEIEDPEALEETRNLLSSTFIGKGFTHVRPWIWSKQTSGGSALTELGHETGYELRFSWYK